jgi:hypothetical protein
MGPRRCIVTLSDLHLLNSPFAKQCTSGCADLPPLAGPWPERNTSAIGSQTAGLEGRGIKTGETSGWFCRLAGQKMDGEFGLT